MRPELTRRPAVGDAVVRVGVTPITEAIYSHWMSVGEATLHKPPPTGPLPQPVTYTPPDFAACVAHLQTTAARSSAAQLRAKCKQTYQGIQARILDFLITAYWLRDEAASDGVSVPEREVRIQFQRERRMRYPTAASFRRLLASSHQTIADLLFAVRTQILSTMLLERFAKSHGQGQSEQTTIAAFNESIATKWTARTDCQPEYVVKDCKQFK